MAAEEEETGGAGGGVGWTALSVSQTVEPVTTDVVTPWLTPKLGPKNCPCPTAPVACLHWFFFPGSMLLCLLHPLPETPGSLLFVCRYLFRDKSLNVTSSAKVSSAPEGNLHGYFIQHRTYMLRTVPGT